MKKTGKKPRKAAKVKARKAEHSCGECWGPGKLDPRPFDHVPLAQGIPAVSGYVVHGPGLPLHHGEHPHSRQDNTQYMTIGVRVVGFDGHRILHRISFEDFNYLSDGLSGDRVRASGLCTIYVRAGKLGGRRVAAFSYKDVQEALIRAHQLLPRVWEGGLEWWRAETWRNDENECAIKGRAVSWKGAPGVVTRLIDQQACVMVKLQKAVATNHSWHPRGDEVKLDLLDPDLNWHPDTRKIGRPPVGRGPGRG